MFSVLEFYSMLSMSLYYLRKEKKDEWVNLQASSLQGYNTRFFNNPLKLDHF